MAKIREFESTNESYFILDGVSYPKVYEAMIDSRYSNTKIKLVSTSRDTLPLVFSTEYTNIRVDGDSFANAQEAISRLNQVVFSKGGGSGGGGTGGYVTKQQLYTSTSWSMNHGLHNPFPSVTVWDSLSNKVVIPSEIISTTEDDVVINFSKPIKGFATFSGGAFAIPPIVIDTDAQNFFTAVPTLDSNTQNAINQLVFDLKNYGLWSKLLYINPKAGSTASEHKWNLKDPRDLDAAYRQTYSGSWVHSRLGMKGNSTNTFANTFLNPSALGLSNNLSFGFYLGGGGTVFGDRHFMGSYSDANHYLSISNSTRDSLALNGYSSASDALNTDATNKGFIAASIIGSSKTLYNKLLKKKVSLTGTTAANLNLYEGALNLNNNWYNGVDAIFGCSFIGQGLTDTEMDNLRIAITTFETRLERN